jgi:hypothetical protein
MAEITGMKQSHFSMAVNGHVRFPLQPLVRIAQHFEVSLDWLILNRRPVIRWEEESGKK